MKMLLIGLSALLVLFVIGCGGGGSTDPIDSETPQTIAIDKIMQYADNNTQPVPSIEDYADAGVVGVTLDNIDDINSVVVSLTASDVDTSDKIQKIVDDLGINILPTANAGPDKNVEVSQAVTISGSGSDIDGTIVAYEWTKDTTVLATTASFEYIPTTVGTDTLMLSVMDDDGGTASDSMNVIVLEDTLVNHVPIADAGSDQSVLTSETVTLNGSGSSDADGDPLTYSWSFTIRPAGSNASLSSTKSKKPTFTADVNGTYVISLVVNDGTLNSDPDSVTITANTVSNTALTFENNTVVPIIDNGIGGAATPSEINVEGATTSIAKVTVTLDITHSWISDLVIRLMSPSGSSIILSNVNIPYAINYTNTTFDDDAITSIEDEDGNITGAYSPVEPLASFNGENSNGIWTLEIHDEVLTDGGALNSWSITIE